ncbi:MAG: acyl carrier protein [Clostridia bacterium]
MVFEKIKNLLAQQLNIPAEKITMESDIIADLGADSLDVVELLMALEETYNIVVPDELANQLKTISSIVDFIEKNKK